jgi:hypothetical protein
MAKKTKIDPRDTRWPPLGVSDLAPDAPARPESLRINSLADKLRAAGVAPPPRGKLS